MSTRKRREARELKEGRGFKYRYLYPPKSFLDSIYPVEQIVRVKNIQTQEIEKIDVSHAIINPQRRIESR